MKPLKVLSVLGFSSLWGRDLPANVLDLTEGSRTIGGGEEAGFHTAAGLRALGHEVVLYWYGQPGVWRGVEIRGLQESLYPNIVGEPWDAVISWSSLRALEYAPKGARRLFAQQLNDLGTLGDWNCVDAIVSPSADHAKQLKKWGWYGKAAVVHNGVDIERYDVAPAWGNRPLDVGYWSSPDRGLHHLLRAWPYVTAQEPKAKLHIFYEIKRYLESISKYPISFYGERGQQVARLLLDHAGDPTVVYHGSVTRIELTKVQKQCRVQCTPLETFSYCEGFSCATAQGLAAGCTVVGMPMDALPSLYRDSIHWMDDLDFMDLEYPKKLAGYILRALRNDLPSQTETRSRARQIAAEYDWKLAGKQMEAACRGENWFTPA